MTTTKDTVGEQPVAEMTAFLEGAVRDGLGLTDEDLRIALRVARLAADRRAFAEAAKTYAAILLCAPADVEAQLGLSACALELDDAPLALRAASAAVSLAPRDARCYLMSGRACLALGNGTEAVEDLADAVKFGLLSRSALVVAESRRLLAAAESTASA